MRNLRPAQREQTALHRCKLSVLAPQALPFREAIAEKTPAGLSPPSRGGLHGVRGILMGWQPAAAVFVISAVPPGSTGLRRH